MRWSRAEGDGGYTGVLQRCGGAAVVGSDGAPDDGRAREVPAPAV